MTSLSLESAGRLSVGRGRGLFECMTSVRPSACVIINFIALNARHCTKTSNIWPPQASFEQKQPITWVAHYIMSSFWANFIQEYIVSSGLIFVEHLYLLFFGVFHLVFIRSLNSFEHGRPCKSPDGDAKTWSRHSSSGVIFCSSKFHTRDRATLAGTCSGNVIWKPGHFLFL